MKIETDTILTKDEPQVQRLILSAARLAPNIASEDSVFQMLFNSLNGQNSEDARKRLVDFFNNNSAGPETLVTDEKPTYAYFSLNRKTKIVIIEWGHSPPRADKSNGVVFSGWMTDLVENAGHIALLNELPDDPKDFDIKSDQGIVLNTMHKNRFYPVTPNGFLQLPAFFIPKT